MFGFPKKLLRRLETSRLRKVWPLGFLVLVWVAVAGPYFLTKITPFPTTYLVTRFPPWQYFYSMPVKNGAMPDVLSQLFPWRQLSTESLKNKIFPLWNPYLFAGNPHLANFQSAPFHPLNLLFFFLPLSIAWKVLVLLQPLLAGFFTYLFCRQIKISQLGSLFSGLAFGFCGFIVVWMAYGTLGFALLWLPLILYGLEKGIPKTTAVSLVAASLGVAFSLFSGHFQTTIYVILASFLYLLFRACESRRFAARKQARKKPTPEIRQLADPAVRLSSPSKSSVLGEASFRRAWSGIFPFLLGFLLAAPQILPAIEFYRLAPRSEIFIKGEVIPWRYLITLIAPDFFGNPVTRNDWFGHYAEWAGFIGTLPMAFALYAIFRKKPIGAVSFFLGLGVFALALALPTPLLDWLINLELPVLSTSAASRIICLFSFSMAVLAGLGLDQWQKDWEEKKFLKRILFFLGLGMVFFLGVWLVLVGFRPLPADKLVVAKRNFILPTGLFFAFAGLSFLVWLLTRLGARKKFLIHYSLFIILFLTGFDLWRFTQKWLPADPEEYLYPRLEMIEFLEKRVGSDRVFGNFGNELAMVFKIPSLEGYDPLYIQRYGELMTTLSDGKLKDPARSTVNLDRNGEYTEKIFRLLGAKYLLYAKDDGRHVWTFPHWQYSERFVEVYSDEEYQVFENGGAFPRAFLVYNYLVEKNDQAIIDKLYVADLRRTVVLEENPSLAIAEGVWEGKVEIKDSQANKVILVVSTPKEGLVFLSDNFYPGWKAYVDDQETKIYRANYSFRAVPVPAGDHEVVFSYQPVSFKAGLVLGGSALVVFLTRLVVLIRQRRKEFKK